MSLEPINYVSVCSGIEAFSVAVEPIGGFSPVAFAEIEAFPSAVLQYHWPTVPNLGDFTAIDVSKLGRVDWLVGGTPCQAFSVAGLRQSLDDDRGNLTLEFVRLAHALAEKNGLRGFLWENVPGCLSTKDNAFGCFVGAIVGSDGPLVPPGGGSWPRVGMVAGPRARLAWRILDSQHFGVPQRRKRVYVVADFGDGPDPAAVLFEPRGKKRRAKSSEKEGQEIAGTLGGSSQSGGFRTTDLDNSGAFIVSDDIAHTLRGEGFDASEDGTGRGTPMVVVDPCLGNAEGGAQDLPFLTKSNVGKHVNNQTPLISVFDPNQITNKTNRSKPTPGLSHALPATENAPVIYSVETAPTLRAGGNKTGGDRPPGSDVDTVETLVVMAFNSKDSGQDAGELSPTLRAAGHSGSHANGGAPPAVAHGMQVRRLTPRECERLQSFPDDHTLIPGLSGWRDVGDDEDVAALETAGLTIKRTKTSNRLRVNDPDGPRYKSLGNSFTVFPVRWIMRRVAASMAGLPVE